ncbi:RNA polymerase sigma factor (sigma-70 family) [Mycobacterium sp. MAA66]|uniref:sigma-70 family RNA polymerase sigma factor n=1 Tax=Mycobacterium sp. MAA66 TaxID=3156297 RepID=UPI003513AE36
MTAVSDWDIVTDSELVGAALTGDGMAFAGIYDRYADRLHDFCVGMVRDRDTAADCVQDVFCTAATALSTLREPDKLRPWLYSIARNEALRRIRQRRREEPSDELPDTASQDAGPDTLAARHELAMLVAEAAGGLSDRDRSVLELGYRHGLEGPELADALGVSTANANKMMQRLRDTMERSLGALLLARRSQSNPNSCAELAAILQGWDGDFNILMRKRIARHIEGCSTCEQDRRRLVNPVALLGGAPMFIPAPAWLRGRTLNRIRLTSAGTDMHTDAPTQALPRGESAVDSDGGVPAQPVRRVLLIMSLLIGIPLIILGLAIAWHRETDTPVIPFSVTSPGAPPTSRAPATLDTRTGVIPRPPAPTVIAPVPAGPTTSHPAPPIPPVQQSPPFPSPVQPPLPPPRRHRPPITGAPPTAGEAPVPPIITGRPIPPVPAPEPPRRRPPIIVGPVLPAPVTTTPPVIE